MQGANEEVDQAMPTLVLSVSGARGIVGDGLDADVARRLAAAFAAVVGPGPILLGRDSRPSGPEIARAAAEGLLAAGCGVRDLGIVTTPTVQVAVEQSDAWGGIIVTASHNPVQWNALKFVGPEGTFLAREAMDRLLAAYHEAPGEKSAAPALAPEFGATPSTPAGVEATAAHVEAIVAEVEAPSIRAAGLRVAVDAVHGAGSVLLAPLLDALDVTACWIDREPDGALPPHPEPRPERLGPLLELVRAEGAQLGFAVDPDGDRCAVVTPAGILGEEWSLPLAAWMRLQAGGRGPLVTNLSTSGRLEQVARRFGVPVERTPVGEAHVVERMTAVDALIGGEGNGGVIDPRVHLGRDAGVAIGLLLAIEAAGHRGGVAGAAAEFVPLEMIKEKITLAPELRPALMEALRLSLGEPDDRTDGLRWQRGEAWLHVRPSGTEPVVRAVAEAPERGEAKRLIDTVFARVVELGGA